MGSGRHGERARPGDAGGKIRAPKASEPITTVSAEAARSSGTVFSRMPPSAARMTRSPAAAISARASRRRPGAASDSDWPFTPMAVPSRVSMAMRSR